LERPARAVQGSVAAARQTRHGMQLRS
jgi:hypothetical protein